MKAVAEEGDRAADPGDEQLEDGGDRQAAQGDLEGADALAAVLQRLVDDDPAVTVAVAMLV